MLARGCPCLRQLFAALALLLIGCTGPAPHIDARAAAAGLARSVVTGIGYEHVTYQNRRGGPTLHVYVENDGDPWTSRYTVASDPTPARPVMLELMALDAEPAVYLGRPCYFGLAGAPPCTPLAWTHERYSQGIVDSMAAALRRLTSEQQPIKLVFFGHSGGGTLAVLLAEHFRESVAVVTLAGNLDVQAWSRLHRYTPLRGSLDPVDRPPLAPAIVQKHYIGSLDRNVTPELLRRYVEKQPRALLVEVHGFDHQCCWHDLWPTILKELRVDLAR